MLQLSTPSTSFSYIRPNSMSMFAVVFLVVFDVMWVVTSHANPRVSPLETIGIPLLATGIGYVAIKALKAQTFDDVDEVWLDGDDLIVKNRGVVSRVALVDVTDVVDATIRDSKGSSPRLRLMLRSRTSNLGDSISFLAGGARGPFGSVDLKSILAMLKRRIDEVSQSSGYGAGPN